MAEEIINRVNQSGLTQIDLEDLRIPGERVFIDIKDQLFQGIALREKDFREYIASHDWSMYTGKHVAVGCSEDAIIPTWAYMLMATKLSGIAKEIVFGDLQALEAVLWRKSLECISVDQYRDEKMVIKGCGDLPVTAAAYTEITRLLTPVVKSIMYGEPCSSVPVFKKK